MIAMPMTNKCFIFFAVFLMISVLSARVSAQDCNIIHEAIFEMPEPTAWSYNIWDRVFGEEKSAESFISGVSLKNENTLVAGISLKDNLLPPDLILVELDKRGRTVWSHNHKIENLVKLVKVIELPDGIMVLADVKKSGNSDDTQVWLGFFSPKGEFKSSKIISIAERSLGSFDIVEKPDDTGFFIAGFVKSSNSSGGVARIYEIDTKGNVQRERSFVPGLENKILSLSRYGEDNYMASGYLSTSEGRKVGWVLRLGKTGQIIWERQYPRGRSAQLNDISQYVQNFVVIAGESYPYGGGHLAAWVVVMDADTGQIAWQRYYKGGLAYSAEAAVSFDNGLMSVLLNARRPKNSDEVAVAVADNVQNYVRLLTINPRGVLFLSDEYFNGEGSSGYELIMGPKKERIIVGDTEVSYDIEDPETGKITNTIMNKEGWAVAAAPMEDYKDPCVSRSLDQR